MDIRAAAAATTINYYYTSSLQPQLNNKLLQ